MASGNLELVQSLYAAWKRGDYSSVGWAHADIEFISADGPAPGKWIGHTGMAEGWREFLSAWVEFRLEAVEYRELEDDRVLVLTRQSGRGKTSGLELAEMETKAAALLH